MDPLKTITEGKTPLIIIMSAEFNSDYNKNVIKDRKLAWSSIKVGIFTLFHEFVHAIKNSHGSNDPYGQQDHKEIYQNDYSSESDDSPSYFDISDPDSPASDAKMQIEKTVGDVEQKSE